MIYSLNDWSFDGACFQELLVVEIAHIFTVRSDLD